MNEIKLDLYPPFKKSGTTITQRIVSDSVDLLSGVFHLNDDTAVELGNTLASPNVKILWETADADANALIISLPAGGAVDVPVVVIGDDTLLNKDLGLFTSVTSPTLALVDGGATKALYFQHNGTDGYLQTTSGNVVLKTLATGKVVIDGTTTRTGTNEVLDIDATIDTTTATSDVNVATITATRAAADTGGTTGLYISLTTGAMADTQDSYGIQVLLNDAACSANTSDAIAYSAEAITADANVREIAFMQKTGWDFAFLAQDGAMQMGDATYDCSTFTMIKGAQTSDPQVQFALSADGNGNFSITADTGDITLTAADDFFVSVDGNIELALTGTALYPQTDGGLTLGITNTNEWNGLYLNASTAISWDNGNQTITQSAGTLTTNGAFAIAGALSGVTTLALSQGITQTTTVAGTMYNMVLATEWTGGTLINAGFATATVQATDMLGVVLDFNANMAGVTDKDVTGMVLKTPALTQSAANTTTYIGWSLPTAGALVQNTLEGTIAWRGLNIQLPNITQTTGAVTSYGIYVNGGTVTSGTQWAIFVDSGNVRLDGELTLGNDADNVSGKINFIASDGDAADISINTSDQLVFANAAGGYTFDADIIVSSGVAIRSGVTNGNTLLIGSNDTTFITITSGATDTCVLADGVAATTQAPGDNSTKVATTAFVTAAIATTDTLAEVLAIGNTTGANDIVVSTTQGISTALVDDNYFLIKAVDNDPNTASEVARAQGAADPYFSAGGTQQFKFYNSGVAAFAGAATGAAFIDISPTLTGPATTNTYAVNISPVGITIPTGTTAIAASLYVAEPIFTETGDLTLGANVYIDAAPTEGATNYSLYVVGTSYFGGAITGTLATAAQTNITSLGTLTALVVDNIQLDGSTISGVTTDANTVITAYAGKAVAIEGVTFDGGIVSGGTTELSIITANATVPTNILVTCGNATSGSNSGGSLFMTAGNGYGAGGLGGSVSSTAGTGGATEAGGTVELTGGNGGVTAGAGGVITLTAGSAQGGTGVIATVSVNDGGTGYTMNDVLTLTTGGTSGTVTVTGVTGGVINAITLTTAGTGYAVGTSAVTGGTGNNDAVINILTLVGEGDAGGAVDIMAGAGSLTSGSGGTVTITAGAAQAGDSDGGDIDLVPGAATGAGVAGKVNISSSVDLGIYGIYIGSAEGLYFGAAGADGNIYLDDHLIFGNYVSNEFDFLGLSTLSATLNMGILTENRIFTFPDATGTFALQEYVADNILSTTTAINAKNVATTNLYTVPNGKTAIITKAIIRVTAADTITVVPTLGIGIAAGEADIFAAAALTGLDSTTEVYAFTATGTYKAGAAAEVIKLGIDTGATATTMTIAVDLIGYLI